LSSKTPKLRPGLDPEFLSHAAKSSRLQTPELFFITYRAIKRPYLITVIEIEHLINGTF